MSKKKSALVDAVELLAEAHVLLVDSEARNYLEGDPRYEKWVEQVENFLVWVEQHPGK